MPTVALLEQQWDIVVVGSGAAAITSALSAATSTTSSLRILLVEKAPEEWAGGNGYFTAAAYRTVHHGLADILPLVSNVSPDQEAKIDLPSYPAESFRADLDRLCNGQSDPLLTKYLIEESLESVKWLKDVGGVHWWLSFRRQSYEVDGRIVFWGGLHLTVQNGGKGLIANLMAAVKKAGCQLVFETAACDVLLDGHGAVRGIVVEHHGKRYEIESKSVVMCAGGYEASPELRKKYLGENWDRAHTRGTPYNNGDMLSIAARLGAQLKGDFSFEGCHSVSWDADSPATGGSRQVTNDYTKNGYTLGLMLNADGKRFVDEGSDLRNYTYAKNGRAVLQQPKSIAWQVWDSDALPWLKPEEYRDEVCRKTWADSLEELAQKLAEDGLDDPAIFVETIEEYNEAVKAHRTEHLEAKLNPAVKDGLSTQSSAKHLHIPKSNWALPIVKSPFMAVKITTGITFTFGGLAINPETATVLTGAGKEITGLHCAGEMVGGLFYGNYPGGSGLTAGAVFGRRAGRAAAQRAMEPHV